MADIPDLKLKITADSSGLEKGLKKSEGQLKNFKKVLGPAAKGVAILGTAVAGTGAAMLAVSLKSAAAQKELKNFAALAKTSTREFEATAHAVNTVGLSAEKFADQTKDVLEKLGEFHATGGGGFRDFFEQVGDRINITSRDLMHLSGPEVLQAVKNAMDEANISMNEQSFLLESLASDTTALIPLLANEGAKMKELTGAYNQATSALQITAGQRKDLETLAGTFKTLRTQSEKATTQLSAALAPALNSFMQSIVSVVPKATQVLIDFYNSLAPSSVVNDIDELNERYDTLTSKVRFLGAEYARLVQNKGNKQQIAGVLEELKVRQAELDIIKEKKKAIEEAAEAERKAAEDIGTIAAKGGTGSQAGDDEKQRKLKLEQERQAIAERMQMVRDSVATEKELLAQKYEEDLQAARDYFTMKGTITSEDYDVMQKLREQHDAAMMALDQTAMNGQLNTHKKGIMSIIDAADKGGKKAFKANKAFALGDAALSMYQGIAKGVSLGWPMAIPAVAYAAATGIQQINAIKSQSYGSSGGGGSKGGGGGGSAPAAAPAASTGGGGGGPNQIISVSPIDPGALFSGQQMIDLINQAQEQGGQLVLGS